MCELKYSYKYPHPSVTTDCVICGIDSDNRLKVLLIERLNEPFKGCWAFPGGFLEMDEDADHGALRELREETGLEVNYLKQFHTFTSPDRDPRERVISIAYYGVVPVQEVAGSDDAARAQWFDIDDVPPLAFDHESMLTMAMEALRQELHLL